MVVTTESFLGSYVVGGAKRGKFLGFCSKTNDKSQIFSLFLTL